VIAGVLLAYAGLQVHWVTRSERLAAQVRERFAATGLSALVPLTLDEYRRFVALALSAGVWEELMFRGFLIAYAMHWIGAGPAIVAAAAAFGLAHLYQGAAGIAKTALAGLVAGLLYWLTGSLWVPMVLHTAVDLHAGTLGYLTLPATADRT
jgi:membrane protease YdiL (CAAX protease family)